MLVHAGDRADRDGVIPTEEDREGVAGKVAGQRCGAFARFGNRVDVGKRVGTAGGFRGCDLDVPVVVNRVTERFEGAGEAGEAEGACAHVHAATAGTEIHGNPEQVHVAHAA